MNKVFITGGSGFLGRHLVNSLSTTPGLTIVSPSSKECNLLNDASLNQFNGIKFDHIFHLAAWTQAGDFCLKYPGDQWIKNQRINSNILDWWSRSQSQAKLVFMGTSCSYPEHDEHIETNYLKGEPTESLYTYAMTKRMLLIGAMALSKQYNLKFCSFVPSTLYGSGYHNDGRQMHFIFDLVRKIVDASDGGPVPQLWGDGNQIRELVHVSDFLDCVFSLIPLIDNDLINIGGFCIATIREFAEIISRLCGYDHTLIRYDTSKYVGAKTKVLSNYKLKNLIELKKQRCLEEGLLEVISWYRNSLEAY